MYQIFKGLIVLTMIYRVKRRLGGEEVFKMTRDKRNINLVTVNQQRKKEDNDDSQEIYTMNNEKCKK